MKKRKGCVSKISKFNTLKRSLVYESSSVPENDSDCIPLEDFTNLPRRNNKQVAFCSSPTYISDIQLEDDASCQLDCQIPLEQQAAKIINVMEQDSSLMADNPSSEQKRLGTLREMTESLTLKRTIRKNLLRKVTQRAGGSPLSLHKRLKYRFSVSLSKFNALVKEMSYSLELWYSSIKVIEGHYGSAVATFFRFFRWIFIVNFIVFLVSHCFVVIPQILYDYFMSVNCDSMNGIFNTTVDNLRNVESDSILSANYDNSTDSMIDVFQCDRFFSVANIISGEGYFTDTSLYYGHYSNISWEAVPGTYYNIPMAYFFTFLFCYLLIFISLSVSMAKSYRKSFIETSRGIKNIYAHKIFCGWDFGIASEDSALLKSKSIFHELKELLNEEDISDISGSCLRKFNIIGLRFSVHALTVIILICVGSVMWLLLSLNLKMDLEKKYQSSMITSLIVTCIMLVSPILFSWIVKFEEYKSPRTAVYVTLIRTYALGVVVISVLVAFWLKKSQSEAHECWETSLGQEVYRLILMDFIIAIMGTALAECIRKQIHVAVWKQIGQPEFNIARNTLNLIYNETLFFVGFFFCPPLSLVIIIKMFITFYIKKFGALKICQPPVYSWRAAQTHTLFLVLSFVSLLGVIIVYGYILTNVEASNCGPFRGYQSMYQMILEEIFQLKEDHDIIKAFMFVTKPGVIAGILIGMCVGVYYLRAHSQAQMEMVDKLQNILLLEAKDKEFLLRSFSKVTDSDWIFHKKETTPLHQNNDFTTINRVSNNGSQSSSSASQKVTEWLLNSNSENVDDLVRSSNEGKFD